MNRERRGEWEGQGWEVRRDEGKREGEWVLKGGKGRDKGWEAVKTGHTCIL